MIESINQLKGNNQSCGVHWLLDLRWIAIAVVVLVGLVVVFTRLMR